MEIDIGIEHVCDDNCMPGFATKKEARKCGIYMKRKWDEMAPGIYEKYRQWLDEEDGVDEEVEFTVKMTSTTARCLDLVRMEKLYFELYKTTPNETDWDVAQSCLSRESFAAHILDKYSMTRDPDNEPTDEKKEEMEDSARECRAILEFHNRINDKAISHQDYLFLKYFDSIPEEKDEGDEDEDE